MKIRFFIVGLIMVLSFVYAQAQIKCPAVIVVRKTLYDSFQSARGSRESLQRDVERYRTVRDDLRQQYQDCEHQTDVAAFLLQADDAVKVAEASFKVATEGYEKLEYEVRKIIDDAHDIAVVYRYYDPGYGNFGRVWTMTFTSREGKIVIVPSYYQLPDNTVGKQ